ncbi:MAG TPA: flagellar biosynthesis protein FlhF [Anaeromyxobacteraceae bacterium]|nr:flagellar biosynthesis protein FlhF [Anaeromyxobacteraceae bacterium]
MQATVRTFRGADSAAALAAAKKELGPDAVVLDARTVHTGVFRRPEVEVTAALGPTPGGLPFDRPRSRPVRRGSSSASAAPSTGAPATASPVPDDVATDLRRLLKEIAAARTELASVVRDTRVARELQLPPDAADTYARLVARGVEPALAEELTRQAMAAHPLEGVAQGVRQLVEEKLLPCRAPWLHGERQVVALVGPTGVGKTTTLAKIAARAILETRKRVALLTVDVYRIGAQEQLARYGEIMNVPVLVARDRTEIRAAMERLRDSDLVLVDTAGRSSTEDVSRQTELVRSVPGILLHLVVSAASGPQQLAAVADRYRELKPDRLVFSKVDEAAAPGAILSAAVRIGRPVACITNGQRVPEDLHPVTGPQLVDLVTGAVDSPPTGRVP